MIAQTFTALETAAAANVDTGIRGQVLAALAMGFVTLMGVAVVWAKARLETATINARAEAIEAQARLKRAEDAVRSTVTGIEASKVDVTAVLTAAVPSMARDQLQAIAGAVHDAVTRKIERVSSDAGTEETLRPIVKETKSAMRAFAEDVGKP